MNRSRDHDLNPSHVGANLVFALPLGTPYYVQIKKGEHKVRPYVPQPNGIKDAVSDRTS